MEAALDTDPQRWTTEDVCTWLLTLEDHEFMLPFIEKFNQNAIDGAVLMALTDAELKDDMGMEALGHRKKLLVLIEELKAKHHGNGVVDRKGKRKLRSVQFSDCANDGEGRQVESAPPHGVYDGEHENKKQKMENTSSGTKTAPLDESEPREFTCPICFDDFHSQREIVTLSNCGHKTCVNCFRQYVQQQVDDRALPIHCPRGDCKLECSEADIARHVNQEYLDRWEQVSLESLLKNKHIQEGDDELRFVCCLTPECKYIVLWHPELDDPHFRCELCRKHYCLKCKCPFHKGKTCIGYKKWRIATGKDDSMFLRYLSKMCVKKCPQCGMFIEKSVGCNSMLCVCGFSFCYFCGKPEATCMCGGAQHYMHPNESWGDENDDE